MKEPRLQAITRTKLLHLFAQSMKPGEKIQSELKLSKQFEVSRTVIRKIISKLQLDGILDDSKNLVHLNLDMEDNRQSSIVETSELQFKNFFLDRVNNGFILPGNKFSVLELADQSGCNRTIVREFLLQFSRYGLVEKLPRKMWGMVEIDQTYMQELLGIRAKMEVSAVKKIFHKKGSHFHMALKEIVDQISHSGIAAFTPGLCLKLETNFFKQLMLVEQNRFTSEFHNKLHYITCFLCQWIPTNEFDQFDFRHTFLVQLVETIDSQNVDKGLALIAEFYTALRSQLEEAIQLLSFP